MQERLHGPLSAETATESHRSLRSTEQEKTLSAIMEPFDEPCAAQHGSGQVPLPRAACPEAIGRWPTSTHVITLLPGPIKGFLPTAGCAEGG
jgi:hypothetical protein